MNRNFLGGLWIGGILLAMYGSGFYYGRNDGVVDLALWGFIGSPLLLIGLALAFGPLMRRR